MRYYFGIYHWRRRLRRLGLAAAAVAAGIVGRRAARTRRRRLLALGAVLVGLARARRPLRAVSNPPPWAVRVDKYERLADALEVPADATLLDVGSGTGRSLVGLAEGLPPGTDVVGLDVFDDRVILGNGPELAARNARRAGLSPAVLAGDASELPVADDSADVVTACRVLHDLPKADAERALLEFRRVLKPGGRLGVLELPIPHEDGAEPAAYWRRLLEDAGFELEVDERAGDDGGYFVFVATLE